MYSSLPFALAQCMVEIPYNFIQVRAAQGTIVWGQVKRCGAWWGIQLILCRFELLKAAEGFLVCG